jgi:hypothetical protein
LKRALYTCINYLINSSEQISCQTVALWENFVDRLESYDSFSAKSCEFLAHGLGVYFSIPIHNLPQSKASKNFYVIYLFLSYLTKLDFPLSRDQTSRSRIWQMIGKKFKCGTFKVAVDDVRYL